MSSEYTTSSRYDHDLSLDLQASQGEFLAISQGLASKTPPGEVWSYIGDFCDNIWLDFAQLVNQYQSRSIVLAKNEARLEHNRKLRSTPLTRAFSRADVTFTERLDGIIGSYSDQAVWETLFAHHLCVRYLDTRSYRHEHP